MPWRGERYLVRDGADVDHGVVISAGDERGAEPDGVAEEGVRQQVGPQLPIVVRHVEEEQSPAAASSATLPLPFPRIAITKRSAMPGHEQLHISRIPCRRACCGPYDITPTIRSSSAMLCVIARAAANSATRCRLRRSGMLDRMRFGRDRSAGDTAPGNW